MSYNVKYIAVLNCEEIAHLISLSRDNKIERCQKIQIVLHNSICNACSGFNSFVKNTGNLLNQSKTDDKMPAKMRREIDQKIKKKLNAKPSRKPRT